MVVPGSCGLMKRIMPLSFVCVCLNILVFTFIYWLDHILFTVEKFLYGRADFTSLDSGNIADGYDINMFI